MSRKQAIEKMCKRCIYDETAKGTWRKQAEECTAGNNCPLFDYRPKSINSKKKDKDE